MNSARSGRTICNSRLFNPRSEQRCIVSSFCCSPSEFPAEKNLKPQAKMASARHWSVYVNHLRCHFWRSCPFIEVCPSGNRQLLAMVLQRNVDVAPRKSPNCTPKPGTPNEPHVTPKHRHRRSMLLRRACYNKRLHFHLVTSLQQVSSSVLQSK